PHLLFGDRRVGQCGQFGDRRVEIGAELFGESAELGEQFIRAQPRRGHRPLRCYCDGFRTPLLRLPLLPLPFPPRAPPRVLGVRVVCRRSSWSATGPAGSDTARVVAYAPHREIVASLSFATTYRPAP